METPKEPITVRVFYTRADMEQKLREWMIAEYGHPRDYITDIDQKERWYRDFGLIYHFICDTYPVE